MTDGTPDLASAAKSAADFLDSYTDESELARRSPLLVEIMRAHAAEVRSALAAHREGSTAPAADDRYQQAVEMVLNSGLMAPLMDDFWAFVDGQIDEDEARKRLQ